MTPYVPLLLAAVADVASTALGLHAGAREMNPLARAAFESLGFLPAAVALKLLAVGVVATCCCWLPEPWGERTVLAIAVLWAGVALVNLLLFVSVI